MRRSNTELNVDDLSDDDKIALCHNLRVELKRRNITQENLADSINCSTKALYNLFSGKVKNCRVQIEEICRKEDINLQKLLKNSISSVAPEAPAIATSKEYGGYSRTSADEYVGRYLMLRRAFSNQTQICGSLLEMDWSETLNCLVFSESNTSVKWDEEMCSLLHGGQVRMSPRTGLVYMNAPFEGAVRTVTLSTIGDDLEMRGVVLSQAKFDTHHHMAVAPVLALKLSEDNYADCLNLLGPFGDEKSRFQEFADKLNEVRSGVLGLDYPAIETST